MLCISNLIQASEPDDASSSIKEQKGRLLSKVKTQQNLFYDAKTIGFDRQNNTTIFTGDVVVIGSGTIITADSIELSRYDNSLNASGHVILLTKEQVFTGTDLTYHWQTGNTKIDNATLIAYDDITIGDLTNKILGLTHEEIQFEANRKKRLEYINNERLKILEDYRLKSNFGDTPPKKMIHRYATLLEQEDLTKEMPNGALAKLTRQRRESYQKRRAFWSQATQKNKASSLGQTSYFIIKGKQLKRTDGNDYSADEAYWTSCKCDEDESPPWAFRSRLITAQEGGYIDLHDAVLEIKGIPILYLPRMAIPNKGTRQSGFLIPTLRTGDRRLGTVYTQPVYFAFADNLDFTLTTDFFQKKGTRLRGEARYLKNKYDGIFINIEGIRDRDWIHQRNTRENLISYYTSDDYPPPQQDTQEEVEPPVLYCQDVPPEEQEQCFEDKIRRPLAVPPNTWRGSQEIKAQFHPSARTTLSFDGELRSDHRYVEDLKLTDSFVSAFQPAQFADSFNTIRGKLAYGEQNFHAGVTSSFGDHVLIPDERFTGSQIPSRIDIVSKFTDLNYYNFMPIPIYANLEYTSIPIEVKEGSHFKEWSTKTTLGSGHWQKLIANFAGPIKSEGAFTIDFFGDAQTRHIKHSGPGNTIGKIHSWLSGVQFHLPLDGEGVIPDLFDRGRRDMAGRRYIHHSMEWNMTLSTRPSVIRRGDYGDYRDENGAPLVYFSSDSKIRPETVYDPLDTMQVNKTISLSTKHSWSTYKKKWDLIKGTKKEERKSATKLSKRKQFEKQALQELMFSTDRMVSHYKDMLSETKRPGPTSKEQLEKMTPKERLRHQVFEKKRKAQPLISGTDWHINRYRIVDEERFTPVTFEAKISFDFEQEKLRKETVKNNRRLEAQGRVDEVVKYANLPAPWSGPDMNLAINYGGFGLGIAFTYNIYQRTASSINFSLGIPKIYNTTLGLSYTLDKSIQYGDNDILLQKKTGTTTASLNTSIIPNIGADVLIIKKEVEGSPKPSYETQIGLGYTDDSNCWGLRFLRSKPFGVDARDATYELQFTVIFLGQNRSLDLLTPLAKEIKGEIAKK